MLTVEDIDQIVEGIENFIMCGDPADDALWQPYVDKLNALKGELAESRAAVNIAAWKCKHCGCIWRDNLDGTVFSLFDVNQRSCRECEESPPDACVIHWIEMAESRAVLPRTDALREALLSARPYVEAHTGGKGLTAGMAEQNLRRIDAALAALSPDTDTAPSPSE